jgi:hypothetical protein
VVGAVEFLAAVALAEFVQLREVSDALIPILIRGHSGGAPAARWRATAASKFFAAIAARVCLAGPVRAFMERLVEAHQCRATPAVAPHVQAVLMTLCLVLVLESIATERALILLLCFVSPALSVALALTASPRNQFGDLDLFGPKLVWKVRAFSSLWC